MKRFKQNARSFLAVNSLVLFVCIFSWPHFAHAVSGTIANDESAVNSACASVAATARCGSETAGHGLVKCIHAYKKDNRKTFKISSGCRTAMKQLEADVKTRRAAKTHGDDGTTH